MNLQHLATFCTVLTEKSMTAASHKLFLTQPAVSLQIRNLEEEIGVDLLVRGVRQVRPTPQGQRLYEYARKILNIVEQAKIAIQTMGAEVTGPVRMGTINSVGLHLVGPAFGLFLRNNNNVRLNIKYGEGTDLIGLASKGLVDLAIIPDAKKEFGREPDDCEKEHIFHDEMWLVSSVKDRDLPKSISLKQFGERPVVMMVDEYPGFENLIFRETKRLIGNNIKPVFESSNVGTLKKAIETGIGWGFLPSHCIQKQVATGRLVRIEVEGFRYETDLYCYLPRSRKNPQAADVFLKALKQLKLGTLPLETPVIEES